MSTTTNYNFPLNDDATTLFSNWWQSINGNNPNSLAVLVDAAIAGVQTAVNNLANLHFVVVATLPTQDIQTNAIYLVPKQDSDVNNVYDEYIYYNNSWELIGTTEMDLSSYVTKIGAESISNKTITLSTYDGYTLGGACAKSVDASISDTTSQNLPTSEAVASYTDSSLDSVSTKPIQNQAVYNALTNKQDSLTTVNVPSGTLDEAIGFDTNGDLVRGAVSGGGGGGSVTLYQHNISIGYGTGSGGNYILSYALRFSLITNSSEKLNTLTKIRTYLESVATDVPPSYNTFMIPATGVYHNGGTYNSIVAINKFTLQSGDEYIFFGYIDTSDTKNPLRSVWFTTGNVSDVVISI